VCLLIPWQGFPEGRVRSNKSNNERRRDSTALRRLAALSRLLLLTHKTVCHRTALLQVRPDRQTLLWSATWPPEVQDVAAALLKNPYKVCSQAFPLSCCGWSVCSAIACRSTPQCGTLRFVCSGEGKAAALPACGARNGLQCTDWGTGQRGPIIPFLRHC